MREESIREKYESQKTKVESQNWKERSTLGILVHLGSL